MEEDNCTIPATEVDAVGKDGIFTVRSVAAVTCPVVSDVICEIVNVSPKEGV